MQHSLEPTESALSGYAEQIGYCDGCGLHDHHLRADLCRVCRKRTPANEAQDDDTLGAEADVTAAMEVLRVAAA